ncbi:hypothetical protein K491DRAFT_700395 [Lophiostoma macrostomum CBS 122681]|uniref:Uncharacterized protein n=1 Tax=Lophiostoma macrostomum CBS 122681 TaxID=1314788 RepID=A0A6A6TS87_9PLEO|nr:hypothetical protein K491DRAFT_700395 [Lophiostoma macrostomum CBS 122681]
MRAVSRLLAAVKPAQYLEAGAPTGLTGLITHPSPRSSLLYLYHSTLDKLKELPESSIYRQSTEALTKHRLKIVDSVKPKGFEEWQQYVKMQVADDPEGFVTEETAGGTRIIPATSEVIDPRLTASEWDGQRIRTIHEGIKTPEQRQTLGHATTHHNIDRRFKNVKLQREPPLTAEQISDIESQIGAGLIEEVVQVAEGEQKLAAVMVEARVWEELEEKAPEGQWTYFERGGHTNTQKP